MLWILTWDSKHKCHLLVVSKIGGLICADRALRSNAKLNFGAGFLVNHVSGFDGYLFVGNLELV